MPGHFRGISVYTQLGALLNYFQLSLGTTSMRKGIRDSYLVTDISLTATGFSGTENIDWVNVKSTFLPMGVVGDTIVLGDSTIDTFYEQGSVSEHFTILGTLNDISLGGDNIDAQLTKWNALSEAVRTAADQVFVQVGINTIGEATPIATLCSNYQQLIDKINTDAPQATVIAGTLTPIRRYKGDVIYALWLLFNEAIKGNGANAITGIDKVAFRHTDLLNDGSGNLLPKYDIEGLHENRAGRIIVARSWFNKYQN